MGLRRRDARGFVTSTTNELREWQRRFRDVRPDPRIYYADLLTSAGISWACFFGGLHVGFRSPWIVALWLIGALAIMRSVYFIHELGHQSPRKLPGFAVAWHVVAGVWALVPGLMIDAHGLHHGHHSYGTDADPEYDRIARWGRLRLVWSVLMLVVVPPLLALRWGLLGPLSWLHPRLRRIVVERTSTLDTNPRFRRALPQGAKRRRFIAQEVLFAGFVWAFVALFVSGELPWLPLLWWWAMTALALMINQVRTLVAHAYEGDGRAMTDKEQLLDTLTLEGGWLTELIAPLGDRFHALHHALPALPYHALGKVHRTLLAELAKDSAYRRTRTGGLGKALLRMWNRAGRSRSTPAGQKV